MRRSSEGAAGGPHHTHTLDVEARPKIEGRPRQQQLAEHSAPLPRPPGSGCGMHGWYAHTCEPTQYLCRPWGAELSFETNMFPNMGQGVPLPLWQAAYTSGCATAPHALIARYGASAPDLN